MQNLIFSKCLILQTLFIWKAEISVTRICLTVGFTFSASHQLPDGADIVLGICAPLLFTDHIQSNIWGAKYLVYWKPLGLTASKELWYTCAWERWRSLSLHLRMHISGWMVQSQSSGLSFLLHPLVAHTVCCAALRRANFSSESVLCLLPRFHLCSYRLVHPCKENNT